MGNESLWNRLGEERRRASATIKGIVLGMVIVAGMYAYADDRRNAETAQRDRALQDFKRVQIELDKNVIARLKAIENARK